ncbi:MAG: gamma-glutamyl-gamma-aminobutyrate hydrolase family protein [Chloroflexi bacterium]|nr:gamma-glutamyl-gamma-aminobutyrate hydrolase family protein [Chloroflexota bacterium]
MPPLIGITCGRETRADGVVRHLQNAAYVNSIVQAGGAPVLIPLSEATGIISALARRIDGLLLSGGGDVDPARYGQKPHPQLGPVDPLRDEIEIALARAAGLRDLPTLAICRGIQVLNVALGGTLYQDIPSEVAGALPHPYRPGNRRDYLAHTVQISPGTRLAAILPTEGPLPVNSMHHQAVRDVAAPFVVSAVAPDGVVEAIEVPARALCLGVQWHPEEMVEGHPLMRRLFAALVQAADQRRSRRGEDLG